MDHKTRMVEKSRALAGRKDAIVTPGVHFVSGNSIAPPYPEHLQQALFGMGCFWGVERVFWQLPGVFATAVGYSGGYTPNPTYEEVCSGKTGHNEVVLVIFDPGKVSYLQLLQIFWEQHNPSQGMRQGNDVGTQYRSGIYTNSQEQHLAATETRNIFQKALQQNGVGTITTEIVSATKFYYAEGYHQQYLAKNPGGYCGLGGTGVKLSMAAKSPASKPRVRYQVPDMVRLFAGNTLDEKINDPANPNLIVDKDL